MKPRLLDLFCGAGGAAMGYHCAGFEVVGVDIDPQPRYPFQFMQGDALMISDMPAWLDTFDAIHASPPCQAYSTITGTGKAKSEHPALIGPTRELLRSIGLPYVIENVENARRHMHNPIRLCGSSFGLAVRRHRWFESNVGLLQLRCNHRAQGRPIGVYGDHPQDDEFYRRPDGTRRGNKAKTEDHARAVMAMPWADWHGCTQAIPPAYTEFIGAQLLAHIEAGAAA